MAAKGSFLISSDQERFVTSQLSDAAQELIVKKIRFTDPLTPSQWAHPDIRDGFKKAMINDSEEAREKFIATVNKKRIADCPVLELIPKKFRGENKVILYIHGGCLTLGSPEYQMQIPAPVSDITGFKVISVDYPLAPYADKTTPYPAHTAVYNVYQELLNEYSPSSIGILSDSAGGNISFGMSLMARNNNKPLPGAVVSYSPWVDMQQRTEAYDDLQRMAQTVVLTPKNLASARDAAFGEEGNFDDSYISPINGSYEGFSSVAFAIFTAGRDLLMPEGRILSENLLPHSKCVNYFCFKGMWHNFQEHLNLKESQQSAEMAAEFFTHNLS